MMGKISDKKKKDNNNEADENKKVSFFQLMKSDKKYNSKVQLTIYSIFVLILIIYLNVAGGSNTGSSGNYIIKDNNNVYDENKLDDNIGLLKSLDDNYRYDIKLEVNHNSNNDYIEEVIRYFGKSYEDSLEINKEYNNENVIYYKALDNYYFKSDTGMNLVSEDTIYNLIANDYVEVENILELLDKSSLDHVTDYSSGKKEYVYHLKVKDIILSYQTDDVVEIEIEEENGIIKMEIDYTNLIKMVDSNISECELEVVITDINKIEKFLVSDGNENVLQS